MPLTSLADRGNRLKAFVEGNKAKASSEPQANGIGDGENVRLSATTDDHGVGSNSQPLKTAIPNSRNHDWLDARDPRGHESPGRLERQKELERLENLFAGSELGEDFMNSDMTMENALHIRNPETQYPDRPSSVRSVHINNDAGRRIVGDAPPGRRYQAEMNDGFSKKAIETQQHRSNHQSQSKPEKYQLSHSQQAAMREVRVSRPRHSHGIRDAATENRRHNGLAAESPDRDNEGDSLMGDEALDLTPRGRRSERPRYQNQGNASPTMRVHRRGQERKRRRTSPDYDDKALSQMSYSDLQNEPFDFDPARAPSKDDSGGASSRIAQVQHMGSSDQQQFFANMSINEWEESGDWFVDKFTDIMKRLREARRNKRQMIQRFEDEATEREELVRKHTDEVDEKLNKMKEDGLKVVGKKRSN